MYRLTYDGSVAEEHGFIVMGGNSEPIAAHVRASHDPAAPLGASLQLAVAALAQPTADGAEPRTIESDHLEAAVLDRTRPRRAFKRLLGDRLNKLLEAKK
jgi:proteasome alpha subunit